MNNWANQPRRQFAWLTCLVGSVSRKRMKSALVGRFLALELGPMIGAVAVIFLFRRIFPAVMAAVALAVFANVALSIRTGAVLENWGSVCQRKKGGAWFWFWIAVHSYFGAFFLAASAIVFLKP